MDIISRAIAQKKHVCDRVDASRHTWDLFDKNRNGKRLFILGAGGGIGYFIRNYHNHIEITGVLDNDIKKQGKKLEDVCIDAVGTMYEGMVITSPDVLKQYDSKEIVVLITVINVYMLMAEQLEQLGIKNYYFLLMMEASKRKKLATNAQEDYLSRYTDWCYKQEIDNNKIIMLIEPYGGHAIQITKALLRKCRNIDIVWIVDDLRIEKPHGVRLILHKNAQRMIYEMATSKIWIFDDIIPLSIAKREGQIYIQVKHWSSITLKKFYLDDDDNHKSESIENAIKGDGERMDYLLSGSEFDESSCRSGFMFKGKAIRVGSPRSDLLFDDEVKVKVSQYFQVDKNSKICLYVPTYRNRQLDKDYTLSVTLDYNELLDVLRAKWGGEWFLLVRFHPGLRWGDGISFGSSHIINAGAYLDSEELAAAADVMITDYSSIMFEGAYVKKPVFLYAPDRNEYIDNERGLLIDYDTLPFPVSENNKELQETVMSFERDTYEREIDLFLDKYGVHEDGHASERAAEFIIELLDEKNMDNKRGENDD